MGKQHTPEHREKIRQALLARGRGLQDKRCNKCGLTKPRAEFGARPNGYSRTQCRACESENWKEWQRANPEKMKAQRWATNLRRWYGLTPAKYQEMLEAQNGLCAICKARPEDSTHGKLFVDHCATTGRIRGLLCNHCNAGIGHFLHENQRMLSAIAYLDSPPHNVPAAPAMPSGRAKLAKTLK